MKKPMKYLWIAFIAAGILLQSGCQFTHSLLPRRQTVPVVPTIHQPTYSTFVSPLAPSTRPNRIVLVEAGPSPGSYGESQKLISELAVQIRSAGLFEVVAPTNWQPKSQMDTILQGRFNEYEIAALSRQHNADAIAFVRVNELQGFAPMRTSITLAIVDSYETVLLYAIDGTWDTSNAATLREFGEHIAANGHTIPGPNQVQLQSPKALLGFASSQIAENLGGAFR